MGAVAGFLSGANLLRSTSAMADLASDLVKETGNDRALRSMFGVKREAEIFNPFAELDNMGVLISGEGLQAVEAMREELDKKRESTSDGKAAVKEGWGGLAELELALEDVGWREMTVQTAWNFRRQALRRLIGISRIMYLINPLIRRAVIVQRLYVWAMGVTVRADDPDVNEVLQDFFQDPKNQSVIGDAWGEREEQQRVDGNTFLVFYLNRVNGTSRVRICPVEQIEDIICNPEDYNEPWFYHKNYGQTSADGVIVDMPPDIEPGYIPDINFNPAIKMPFAPNGARIYWDRRILHIKTGGLPQMKFGVPELYSALGWALAYKKILENFATILAAYARYAMKITGNTGKKGVAATKAKLNTSIAPGNLQETNPTANTASWFLSSGGMDAQPIKTANSTTGPDEARALRSMVAAGTDTPEHFFGDSDIGKLATASTLDRPTELKMIDRQQMWANVIRQISRMLIIWSARSPYGKLGGKKGIKYVVTTDAFDGTRIETVKADPALVKTIVQFPNILERDVTDRVRALVAAVTLGGSKAEGIFPERGLVFKLLLEALGEKDANEMMLKYYPEPVLQGFIDPADEATDNHLGAEGKKELGDAALIAAKAKKKQVDNPPPVAAPSAASEPTGGSNV